MHGSGHGRATHQVPQPDLAFSSCYDSILSLKFPIDQLTRKLARMEGPSGRMDHYKVLGLHRNATKDEIKESFRKLAIKYHPDKHSHSSKAVREDATVRFKRLSEAYQVLIDDRKRSDYNVRTNYHGTRGGGTSTSSTYGSGYSSSYRGDYGRYQNYAYSSRNKDTGGFFASKVEAVLRLMTTRAFLLNAAFACVLFGASAVVDSGREALWKMQNPGKSFEEAMESIEKAKARRE